jgi:hypothetical protein
VLGAYPPPAQIAWRVPEVVNVAVLLWVDEVVGVLPSVVRYGTVPAVGHVTVAVTEPE